MKGKKDSFISEPIKSISTKANFLMKEPDTS